MKKTILALAILASPALAEAPPPYPEFTFKRVAPPSAEGGKRITVQITPQVTEPTIAPDTPIAPAPSGTYGWYWEEMSPDLAASGPGRLDPAVQALAKGPGGAAVAAPRLQQMQALAAAHGIDILVSTVGTDVSPALVLAVMSVESAGNPTAESDKGAQGLMQLIPATAERFGVEDSLDPAQNIRGGVAYLNWLMGEFGRDPIMVLAAYNAGENAIRAHEGVPPFAETRDYVPKVLAAWQVAKGLCVTPPQLMSDGCVFITNSSG